MRKTNELLELAQAVFNYTDEDMKKIEANPKYMQVIEKMPHVASTELIFKVEAAHGCACQHETGQRIKISADGSIKCQESPPKLCVYLLNAIMPIVYGAQEFIFQGLDPNELKFTNVGCFDNGITCGGFGHVSVQFSAQQS
jgi:uncharacterized repeat protein (TIGR04076 family)